MKKLKQLSSINNTCPNRYVHGFFQPVPFYAAVTHLLSHVLHIPHIPHNLSKCHKAVQQVAHVRGTLVAKVVV